MKNPVRFVIMQYISMSSAMAESFDGVMAHLVLFATNFLQNGVGGCEGGYFSRLF